MRPDLILRPLRPGDGDALADLHRRAIMAIEPRFYSKHQLASWAHGIAPGGYACFADCGSTFVLAETASRQLAGVACHGTSPDRTGRILMLFVHPDHQRRGIGGMLLAQSEADLAELGAEEIKVESSLSAVSFYLSQGYQEGHRDLGDTPGGLKMPIRWMHKDLAR